MRKFILTLLIVVGLGLFVFFYLKANPSVVPEGNPLEQVVKTEEPEPIARTPQDYHIMEAEGGIPLAEVRRAGLTGADYAYLQGLGAISLSDGVEPYSGITVRGLHFDLGYIFNSVPRSPQSAEFNVGGEWDELHFGIGFDDSHASDPDHKWAIDFEVQADGKVVFGPERIDPTTDPVYAGVDVKGVHRVTFVATRVNKANPFTPVLLDPFVRKYPEAPAE